MVISLVRTGSARSLTCIRTCQWRIIGGEDGKQNIDTRHVGKRDQRGGTGQACGHPLADTNDEGGIRIVTLSWLDCTTITSRLCDLVGEPVAQTREEQP